LVKVIGTDSGTKSYDIFGFDDETGEVFVDESIPRDLVVENPYLVVKRLKELDRSHRVDAIVASSGYGIPLKLAKEATLEEIALATFITERDVKRGHRIVGLRKLLRILKEDQELNYKTYFTPGVIHLPTVPVYRKLNRVDMGTSDKVYTAALAIARFAETHGVNYRDVNLIAVEVGFAYTSALAVSGGCIVDAMAGTAGFPGYLGAGFMDSELAYALANAVEFTKEILFRGGAAYLLTTRPFEAPIESVFKPGTLGYELMVESIVKDALALMCSTNPRVLYLSGRFSQTPFLASAVEGKLREALGAKAPLVLLLKARATVAKQAAEGAAIVASGLAGGKYRDLVDAMRLKESKGTIFDYVTVVDKELLLSEYSKYVE